MIDLGTNLQDAVLQARGFLNSLPFWAALLLLFAPTLFALVLKRNATTVAAAGLLSVAGLVLFALGPNLSQGGLGLVLTFTAALLASIYGLHDQRQQRRIASIDERLEHLDRQVMVFLEAIDRRTTELDRITGDVRAASENAKVAIQVAQRITATRPPPQQQITAPKPDAPALSESPDSSV